ncbi:hypothetical protein GCM10027578_41120 [Spirosoma luteolum]
MLVGYYFLYRKYIYAVIDPLFLFVLATSFASVLVIEVVVEEKDIWHFFACQAALILGFYVAYKKLAPADGLSGDTVYGFTDQKTLEWTTYVLLSIYIVANIIVAYTKGFALLSDAPTESKVANFQGGFGIFRKINWGVGIFISSSFLFLYLIQSKSKYLYFLLIVAGFTALEGSKGSLLRIVIAAGLVFYHPAFWEKRRLLQRLKIYTPVALIAVLGVVFTVLVKENDGASEAFVAFIRRLLYGGDVVLYFYTPQNADYFANFTSLDYFVRLINPITGFFRIQPYQEALGNVMVENIRPPGVIVDVTVGPNTPFYIEGLIYFGYWGGIIYSFVVGLVYALMRVYYFSIVRSNAFFFVFAASFLQLVTGMLTDVNLAVTQTFDMIFFSLPVYILVSLYINRSVGLSWVIRKGKRSPLHT